MCPALHPTYVEEARMSRIDAQWLRASDFSGTYTVDSEGEFTGNRVEGSTFPNWIGGVRTRKDLRLVVKGERMFESFIRPDGGVLTAEFVRVR
jgi:hypothetical protein